MTAETRDDATNAPQPRAPDAPWERQSFPEVVPREDVPRIRFGSVAGAIRWAMHSAGGAKAFDPAAVHGLGSDHEEAMVARGWILLAIDAVPVGCRVPLLIYASRIGGESIEHVANVLRVKHRTAEGWVREGERHMLATLEPRGIVW